MYECKTKGTQSIMPATIKPKNMTCSPGIDHQWLILPLILKNFWFFSIVLILILVLTFKSDPSNYWFWFWSSIVTIQLLILILMFKSDHPTIDFDFDVQKWSYNYWFWFWCSKVSHYWYWFSKVAHPTIDIEPSTPLLIMFAATRPTAHTTGEWKKYPQNKYLGINTPGKTPPEKIPLQYPRKKYPHFSHAWNRHI